MMKVLVGYPSEERVVIVERVTGAATWELGGSSEH